MHQPQDIENISEKMWVEAIRGLHSIVKKGIGLGEFISKLKGRKIKVIIENERLLGACAFIEDPKLRIIIGEYVWAKPSKKFYKMHGKTVATALRNHILEIAEQKNYTYKETNAIGVGKKFKTRRDQKPKTHLPRPKHRR